MRGPCLDEARVCSLHSRGCEPDSSQAGKPRSREGMLGVPQAGLDKRTVTHSLGVRNSLVCGRLPSVHAQPWWFLSSAYKDTGQIGEPTRMPSFYLHHLCKGPSPKQSHLEVPGC